MIMRGSSRCVSLCLSLSLTPTLHKKHSANFRMMGGKLSFHKVVGTKAHSALYEDTHSHKEVEKLRVSVLCTIHPFKALSFVHASLLSVTLRTDVSLSI